MEQRRNLLLVGLQLVESAQQMRPRAARCFQLDHTQRQAVNEHHHIGPPLVLAVDHNELAHRQPVVQFRMLKIDERDFASGQRAIMCVVFDVHTFRHQLVEAAVLFKQ
ncbi:hypothetical protein D3C85_1547550 [compost metagenome]